MLKLKGEEENETRGTRKVITKGGLMSKRKKKYSIDEIPFYKSIGEKIKKARLAHINNESGEKRLCTQTELSKVCDCTFQQIQKYEKAANRIPLIKLIIVADYLDKPISYFINEKELVSKIKPLTDSSDVAPLLNPELN